MLANKWELRQNRSPVDTASPPTRGGSTAIQLLAAVADSGLSFTAEYDETCSDASERKDILVEVGR